MIQLWTKHFVNQQSFPELFHEYLQVSIMREFCLRIDQSQCYKRRRSISSLTAYRISFAVSILFSFNFLAVREIGSLRDFREIQNFESRLIIIRVCWRNRINW
jgi:hypothetical protein